jgi:lambda repressor-like predicted transcriptional regulator
MGAEWHREHWFATLAERDAALSDMSRKHEYSRVGDKPALLFDKVENLAASRGL